MRSKRWPVKPLGIDDDYDVVEPSMDIYEIECCEPSLGQGRGTTYPYGNGQ